MKKLLCWLFGHQTKGFHTRPDVFLGIEFDPSGRHLFHSWYKPHALCPQYAMLGMDWKKQDCNCERCGEWFWTFTVTRLDGYQWGKERNLSVVEVLGGKKASIPDEMPTTQYAGWWSEKHEKYPKRA